MEHPSLLEIIREDLIPSLSSKNLSKSTDDSLILTQGFSLPIRDLFSKQMTTQEGNNLKNALILVRSGGDPFFSINKLEKVCSAYENLILAVPNYNQSLFEVFAETLGILGSCMSSIFDLAQLFSIIRKLKYKGNDISSIILSIYPNYSLQVQTELAKINQNLHMSFRNLEELLKIIKKGEKTGLDNQDLIYIAIDSVFSYIEQEINYPAIIESGIKKVNNNQSAILLYYLKNFGNLSISQIQRLDRFINIVGIEVPLENNYQNSSNFDYDLPNLNFDESQIREIERAIYAYEHKDRGFHVEVKRCIYKNESIAVKRYSALEGMPWNPNDYFDEIKILKKCSELNNSCFLKFYGATVKTNDISIYFEHLDENLDQRINNYRNKRKSNFAEFSSALIQLVQGFASLETIGIMHKDIKPGNILISGEDEHVVVKIIDFGYSKIKTVGLKTTHTAKAITTQNYRAPELLGKDVACFNSFKADAFSLGLTLYEMYSLEEINGLNKPENRLKLLEGLSKIKVVWIYNLLTNLLTNVERRYTIKECLHLLPGTPT